MTKQFDLENRTEEFAKDVIQLCKKLSRNTINIELISQAVRASGSIGTNYIETNEALSKKDFYYKIKLYRKESKECRYWLKLILSANNDIEKEVNLLIKKSTELMNIFGSIVRKES